MPTTLVLVAGQSYRVGQVGAFFRIPLGYTNLYAICTQVGADAIPEGTPPPPSLEGAGDPEHALHGYRWLTVALFGEAVGGVFQRGVGEYPTVGDQVHLVTNTDLRVIYESQVAVGAVAVGTVASSTGIPAHVSVSDLVSRHSAIVGSTGTGKSNLMTVLLEELTSGVFPAARVVVIDPHGEYASAVRSFAEVFAVNPDEGVGEKELSVPFWALPLTELLGVTTGPLQPNVEAAIRDKVLEMKVAAAESLDNPPGSETLSADSPIPFSIRRLWFELDDFERQTFSASGTAQNPSNLEAKEEEGDASSLRFTRYPAASPYNQAPYRNQKKRNIERQLDLMRSRLLDSRFEFLFSPGQGLAPSLDGRVENDLDVLLRGWVGHSRPLTVFDVSGFPSEILGVVVGTMIRIIYDCLFWAMDLPIGGRSQPLLLVLEEAHLFLPDGSESAAHRIIGRVAKEGRKYGVGLALVTQRPVDLDSAVLSQCGTIMSLRLTNSADRARVTEKFPDDLGGLSSLLPALRTGEGIFVGEAFPIPSRVRVRHALHKQEGSDPPLLEGWRKLERPDGSSYAEAVANWRTQSRVSSPAEGGA